MVVLNWGKLLKALLLNWNHQITLWALWTCENIVFFIFQYAILVYEQGQRQSTLWASPIVVFSSYLVYVCQELCKLSYSESLTISLYMHVSECLCERLSPDIYRKLWNVIQSIFENWIRMNACQCLNRRQETPIHHPGSCCCHQLICCFLSVPSRRGLIGNQVYH